MPTAKLRVHRVWASRSVSVCSLHVRDSLTHLSWRGNGIVCREDLAIDQRGGRVLSAAIKREIKASQGRVRNRAGTDVASHLGRAGGGDAGLGQKREPSRGVEVNRINGARHGDARQEHQRDHPFVLRDGREACNRREVSGNAGMQKRAGPGQGLSGESSPSCVVGLG